MSIGADCLSLDLLSFKSSWLHRVSKLNKELRTPLKIKQLVSDSLKNLSLARKHGDISRSDILEPLCPLCLQLPECTSAQKTNT